MLKYIEEKAKENENYFKGKKVIELGAGIFLSFPLSSFSFSLSHSFTPPSFLPPLYLLIYFLFYFILFFFYFFFFKRNWDCWYDACSCWCRSDCYRSP